MLKSVKMRNFCFFTNVLTAFGVEISAVSSLTLLTIVWLVVKLKSMSKCFTLPPLTLEMYDVKIIKSDDSMCTCIQFESFKFFYLPIQHSTIECQM